MSALTGMDFLYSSLSVFYVMLFFLVIIAVTILLVIGLQLSRTNKELKEVIKGLIRSRRKL